MTHTDNDRQDKMMRDIEILARLKKEEEENFSMILAGIRRRRIRRIVARTAYSCAAAVVLGLVLHYTFRSGSDISDTVELPTLITDSGECVQLDNDFSYTLELDKEAVSGLTAESAEAARPAAPARQTETAKRNGTDNQKDIRKTETLHAAASVTKNTVIIPQGYTYNIRFDDGSEAYINSGSYIEFPKSFIDKNTRRVALTGEAYFKVAKSDKPFIVSANGVEVKVYGTEFNVNTNREGRVETLLVSGSVGVRREGSEDEVLISPEQMLTYDLKSGTSTAKAVNPQEYLAWMTGDFTYTERPLTELLDEISTFYNIEIETEGNLQDQLVTISLSRRLGHRQLMEILEPALGLEFTNTGKKTYKCKTNY